MARTRQARRCLAHKPDGNPCGAYAIAGSTVCLAHGARPKHVRAKAAVRAELANWGLNDATEDPGEVLLRLVTQAARRASHYAALLAEQYDLSAAGAATTTLPKGVSALIGHKRAVDRDGSVFEVEEAIRGLVELEGQERDRCARFAKLALDAGIAEREIRLAENQADELARLLSTVLSEMGMSHDQQREARARVASHLRIAATG
jgi:hypothetical protein